MKQNMMMQQKGVRMKFSSVEDIELKRLVQQSGNEVDWKVIAESMGNGRTARQCRERFRNYLSPKVKNGPWTPEEEKLLEEKYQIFGPKWSKMSKFFKGRSDVNLKNHWVSMLNRKSKEAFETKQKIEIFTEVPKINSPMASDVNTESEEEAQQESNQFDSIKEFSGIPSPMITQTQRCKSTIAAYRDDWQQAEKEINPDEFELNDFEFNLDFNQSNDPFVLGNEDFGFAFGF